MALNPTELFKNPKRLKELMKILDKADGKHDGIVHKAIALRYIQGLKKKPHVKHSMQFLNAAEAFIQQGPDIQRRLTNKEIDALSQMVSKKKK